MAPETSANEFRELLEEELKSCVMPSIKDPANATAEELMRDMHRVLGGNGGFQRGMLYKLAATSAHVKILDGKVSEQASHCQSTHQRLDERIHALDKEVADVDGQVHKRIVGFVVKHKTSIVIGLLLLIQLVMFGQIRVTQVNSTKNRDEVNQTVKLLRQVLGTNAVTTAKTP